MCQKFSSAPDHCGGVFAEQWEGGVETKSQVNNICENTRNPPHRGGGRTVTACRKIINENIPKRVYTQTRKHANKAKKEKNMLDCRNHKDRKMERSLRRIFTKNNIAAMPEKTSRTACMRKRIVIYVCFNPSGNTDPPRHGAIRCSSCISAASPSVPFPR